MFFLSGDDTAHTINYIDEDSNIVASCVVHVNPLLLVHDFLPFMADEIRHVYCGNKVRKLEILFFFFNFKFKDLF